MTILITGATGYIGKDVVKKLAKTENMRIFTRKNIKSEFETVKGNLLDVESIRKAMKGVDCVFHLGAQTSRFASAENLWSTNYIGTANILNIAKEKGIEKIIYTSSEAVTMPILDAFGHSKAESEKLIAKYWKGMTIPVIRAPYIYDAEKLEKLRKLKILPMVNKDFLMHLSYKKSVIEALINAMKYGKSEIYHVADAKPVSLHELYLEILEHLGKKPIFIPYFFVDLATAFAYLIEKSSKVIRKRPPITPAFIRSVFQNRTFDINYSSKKLRYKPVDTLDTVRSLLKQQLTN